jgi:hypothetical protein
MDLQAAVSYLAGLPYVHAVGMVGLCTSGANCHRPPLHPTGGQLGAEAGQHGVHGTARWRAGRAKRGHVVTTNGPRDAKTPANGGFGVGDTGLEPVTSALSRLDAPAAEVPATPKKPAD